MNKQIKEEPNQEFINNTNNITVQKTSGRSFKVKNQQPYNNKIDHKVEESNQIHKKRKEKTIKKRLRGDSDSSTSDYSPSYVKKKKCKKDKPSNKKKKYLLYQDVLKPENEIVKCDSFNKSENYKKRICNQDFTNDLHFNSDENKDCENRDSVITEEKKSKFVLKYV